MHRLSYTLLLLTLLGCIGPISSEEHYSFIVANDQLFAVRHGGYYGTESGVFTTSDDGQTWAAFNAPAKTLTLCGHEGVLFALTSKAELFRKPEGSSTWTRIWSGTARRHTYDVDCAPSGELYVTSAEGIIVLSPDGAVVREYAAPRETLYVGAFFADDRHLVVSCNPFRCAVVDTVAGTLRDWNEGFSPLADDGLRGPCDIKQHGTRFLAGQRDGIYISDGLMKPWSILNDEIRHEGLKNEFCRDLCTLDGSDQWLVATGSGIHLMKGSEKQHTVFEDVKDDHGLILRITPYRSNYFVSFARLNNSIGVRLDGDLESWHTMRLGAE